MIRNLFIPEKFGSYYTLKTRIIAIEIGPSAIYAASISAQGRSRVLEKVYEEYITTELGPTADDRIVAALTTLATKLGSYNHLRLVIPSSQVVFKELTLPFHGQKKIKLVIPFEVEPLLPFSADQAAIDSIVTKVDETSTTVFVAATQKTNIDHYHTLFSRAGLFLDSIHVDMLELYGLYYSQPHADQSVALIDIGYHTSTIGVIENNQLRYVRSITRGLNAVAKQIAQKNDAQEVLNNLVRAGTEADTQLVEKTHAALKELFDEITLSIDSFIEKNGLAPLSRYLVTGVVAQVPDAVPFMRSLVSQPIEPLEITGITHENKNSVAQYFTKVIATAAGSTITDEFSLDYIAKPQQAESLLNKQLLWFAGLCTGLLLTFGLYSFFRIRNLRSVYSQAETEAISDLQKYYKLKPEQSFDLAEANRAASTTLKKQETVWNRLSDEYRFSFLRYLAALSQCINAKDVRLDLVSLSIKDDVIKIYGSVPGYAQLTQLQHMLDCPSFKKLPKLQDWNFKTEPITLHVNTEGIDAIGK